MEKRRAQRLVGESMREVGVLLLVFAPLDAFYSHSANWPAVWRFTAVALLLICIGIILETREA